MKKERAKIKVCYTLSYKAPDYVRTRVLLKALSDIPDIDLYTAINTRRSSLRYAQTLLRLLLARLKYHPDIYILGFRGQDIFWPVRILTIGKPLFFDEFINMHDWLGEENNKLPGLLIKLADWYETMALKSSRLILTDTKLGAEKSSRTYNIPAAKFRTIYVGTDENIFKPRKEAPANKTFEVFFYGNMAPLHGIEIIIEAAARLKDRPIHFTIVGGKGHGAQRLKYLIEQNRLDNVTRKDWIDFDDLPKQIAVSDLFLGGPFGNTSQAKRVITGKTYQALAVGTPVVVGKINEDVGLRDKVNCFLAEQGSAAALAVAIEWSWKNSGKLEEIGRSGRRLFEEKFSTQAVSEKLNDIIKETKSRATV